MYPNKTLKSECRFPFKNEQIRHQIRPQNRAHDFTKSEVNGETRFDRDASRPASPGGNAQVYGLAMVEKKETEVRASKASIHRS